MRTWEGRDPDFGRPIAAPLERCADLLSVDPATVRQVAVDVEHYVRVDGQDLEPHAGTADPPPEG